MVDSGNSSDASKASSNEVSNGNRLTSILLNGRNYLPWSRAVMIALGGRSKQGHINGTIKSPPATDPKFVDWQTNDHLVMSCVQAPGHSFTIHLGTLKKKWDELKQYRPPADSVKTYIEREEQDRVFQLLASLRPEYEDLRRQILMSTPLPSFGTICSIIQREETRSRVMNYSSHAIPSLETSAHSAAGPSSHLVSGGRASSSRGRGRGRGGRYHCDHCSKDGHSKDRCWVLHPHLRPSKDKVLDVNMASHVTPTADFQSSLDRITQQLQQLMAQSIPISEHGNMAQSGNIFALSALSSKNYFVVDSGASEHMCGFTHGFSDFCTIAPGNHFPITVANGNQVPVEGRGTISLFSSTIDVLFVPQLTSNLLSVSKLTT